MRMQSLQVSTCSVESRRLLHHDTFYNRSYRCVETSCWHRIQLKRRVFIQRFNQSFKSASVHSTISTEALRAVVVPEVSVNILIVPQCYLEMIKARRNNGPFFSLIIKSRSARDRENTKVSAFHIVNVKFNSLCRSLYRS